MQRESEIKTLRMIRRERRYTTNRLVCVLMWWLWESHAPWPKCRVIRVYSYREYFTASGHHLYATEFNIWQQFYRAVGMVFPWLKSLWDRLEKRLWPERL